jgi:hypothetical protein
MLTRLRPVPVQPWVRWATQREVADSWTTSPPRRPRGVCVERLMTRPDGSLSLLASASAVRFGAARLPTRGKAQNMKK